MYEPGLVPRKLCVRRVEIRLVGVRLRHPAGQVVGHPEFADTAEVLERAHVAAGPARQVFAQHRLDVGEVAGAEPDEAPYMTQSQTFITTALEWVSVAALAASLPAGILKRVA